MANEIPSDDEIRKEWVLILGMHAPYRGSLARRIALLRADALEARGVTEADIDRIMGLSPQAREGDTTANPSLDADQLQRAFLRLIQEENGCNRVEDRYGFRCGARCGCHVAMMGLYEEAE